MAEDRPVLHEPVVQEDLLALADVLAREEDVPLPVDDPLGDGRLRLVGAVGEQAEDEEAEQDDERDGLEPALRDQELTPSGGRHWLLLRRRTDRIRRDDRPEEPQRLAKDQTHAGACSILEGSFGGASVRRRLFRDAQRIVRWLTVSSTPKPGRAR